MTPILPGKIKEASFPRNAWHIPAKASDDPRDLLDPKYWVHVSRMLRGGDKIEILAETNEWYAEAIVLDSGAYGAKIAYVVGPIRLTNEAEIDVPEDYEIKWSGPHTKFRVIRKSDNKMLRDQFTSKEEASSWVRAHRQAMAA